MASAKTHASTALTVTKTGDYKSESHGGTRPLGWEIIPTVGANVSHTGGFLDGTEVVQVLANETYTYYDRTRELQIIEAERTGGTSGTIIIRPIGSV